VEPRAAPTATLSPEAAQALADVYARVDREIRSMGATCWLRGRCCDFETAEHVLFASSAEIAFVRAAHAERFAPHGVLCPFWKDGLCAERERRPLGCRTYFCDPAYSDRVASIHERYHREICALADRFGIEYRYEPFVAALRGGSNADAAGVELWRRDDVRPDARERGDVDDADQNDA